MTATSVLLRTLIERYLEAVDSYLNMDKVAGLGLNERFRVLDNYREAKRKLQDFAALPPAPPQDQERREAAERLRYWVRAQHQTCRILSIGDACQCPLCDVDRLAASTPAQEQDKWQPIETAPDDTGKDWVIVCVRRDCRGPSAPIAVPAYREDGIWHLPVGYSLADQSPTHWMPFPGPPAQD